MHMPIAQMSPVFVTFITLAALAVIFAHIWIFRLLNEMRRLNIRVIESMAESTVAIARLEQTILASSPGASEMKAKAAAVAKAMQRSGADLATLLTSQPPGLGPQ
jgi:hypothetical protein